MNLLTRATTAVRAGIQVFRGYSRANVVPVTYFVHAPSSVTNWEAYDTRLWRYNLFDLYAHNAVYTALETAAKMHKFAEGLYKYTRTIYNPVQRSIDAQVGHCYAGALDMETLEAGAVPLLGIDDTLRAALRNVWKWSDWARAKMLYTRTAARYGDAVLKVVDDVQSGKVRLEVLHPGVLRDVEMDGVGFIKRAVIEYLIPDPDFDATEDGQETQRLVTYREEITQERFATYIVRNGEATPYAFQRSLAGEAVAEWENPYGFVPVTIAKARDEGMTWGLPLYATTLPKIDQLNALASLLADQVQKAVIPYFGVFGGRSIKDERTASRSSVVSRLGGGEDGHGSERSGMYFLHIGDSEARVEPLVVPLDITGALEAVHSILREVEADMPELAFARVRDLRLESSPAVRAALGDAVARLQEFNANMDAPLIRALQMAVSIGGYNNYPGFEPFDLTDYAAGNLDFSIRERPIIGDELSKQDEISLLMQSEAAPMLVWRALGLSEDEIAQSEAYAESVASTAVQDLARVIAGAAGG